MPGTPTARVDFDLDSATRERTFTPFTFSVGDRVISLSDPAELDYKELLEVETPLHFLRYTATQEDRDFLRDQNIPSWKLGKLMEAYYKHFELDKDKSKLGF